MINKKKQLLLFIVSSMISVSTVLAQIKKDYHTWATTPPLGWNSWDCFGTTVTEQQIKEQADAMAKQLLPSGYKYLTVDIQWYEPEANGHAYDPKSSSHHGWLWSLNPRVEKVSLGCKW